MLGEEEDLVTNGREKADVLDASFSSLFTGMASPQAYHIPEPPHTLSGNEAAPTAVEERTKELLALSLDIHKFMGPLGMHPRVFR